MMKSNALPQKQLQKVNVNFNVKIAMMWISLMFLIIYIDYFALYMPQKIEELIAGKVFVFQVSQGFLFGALTSVTIPSLMIFLSVVLPSNFNRRTNIIVAAVYIPFIVFNLAGEAWMHMIFGAFIEVVLLCLIIYYAWKWPRIEKSSKMY